GFTSELHGAFIDATMFFSLIAKLSTITWVSLPTGKSDLMKKIEKIIGWVAVVPFVLILSSCKEGPPEETAEKPTIQAPKKIVKETPDEPVVAETDSREDDRDKRRQEWENMSDEDKAARKAEWDKRREEWENMSEEDREKARDERRKQFMAEVDKNGDGNLGKDELPERMWEFMSKADKDGDNQITEVERTEFRAEMEAERAIRELSGEESPRRGFGPPGGGGDRRGKGGFGGGKGGRDGGGGKGDQ
ncbi:hypothetical protein N8813_02830, partial [bacterium]|nr:hypothetical protein [bacterium]